MPGKAAVLVPQFVTQNVRLDDKGRPLLKKKQAVMSKSLTDAQLKKRKRLSATTAIVTSTMGLGALGAKGVGSAVRRAGKTKGSLKMLRRGRKIEQAAVPTTLVSGGIGGLSGYNFASVQRAEAKKRNMAPKPVSKAFPWQRTKEHRAELKGLRKVRRTKKREYKRAHSNAGWNAYHKQREEHPVKAATSDLARALPMGASFYHHGDYLGTVWNPAHFAPYGSQAQQRALAEFPNTSYGKQKMREWNRAKAAHKKGKKELRKSLVPLAKAYNPEHNRASRNRKAGTALAVGGGAAGAAGAGYFGRQALKNRSAYQRGQKVAANFEHAKQAAAESHKPGKNTGAQIERLKRGAKVVGDEMKSLRKVGKKPAGKAGLAALAGAGAVAGGVALRKYPDTKRGRSYTPRYRPHG